MAENKLSRGQILQEISTAILSGETNTLLQMIEQGFKLSMSATELLDEAMIPAIKQLSQRYQGADFYIPDVLISSQTVRAGFHALKPHLVNKSYHFKRVVIGTVEGDIHDIGKNLVSIYLESAGFEVIDLGVDVPTVEFIKAVKEYKPDILALSALLTTTMGEMANIIKLLSKSDLRHTVKVIVGGGPVMRQFAARIGADLYANDAPHAVKVLHEFFEASGS
jgi:5-methyltetrahydrofolate--homocysteine methyltransferase